MSNREISKFIDASYKMRERTLTERWLPIMTGLSIDEIDADKEWETRVKDYLMDQLNRGKNGLFEYRRFVTSPVAPESLVAMVEDYNDRKYG